MRYAKQIGEVRDTMKVALKGAAFCLIAVIVFSASVQGVSGQGAIQVERNAAQVDYPLTVRFLLEASSSSAIESVTLIYSTNALSCEGGIAQQEVTFEPGERIALEWDWKLERAGALPPGAVVTWQWQLRDRAGSSLLTGEQSITIQDERHAWQTIQTADGSALIQWYQGSRSFGSQVAAITQNSLRRLSTEIGIQIERQVNIIIYPTSQEVKEVMIVAHEWVGGVAFPEYGSVIFGAQPDETAWLEDVIPHELAHLLVGELTFNCKGIRLPTWLSEGLSVVSEGALSREQYEQLEDALAEGRLRPFHALERGFSVDAGKVALEYDQSGALVEFMLAEYGAAKMADLLQVMKNGLLIEPALLQVYGLDTDGLDSAWRVARGFEALPTPAPTSAVKNTAVPTLALSTSVVRSTLTPTPALATSTATPPPPTATPAASPTSSTGVTHTPPALPEKSRSTFPACGSFGVVFIPLIIGLVLRRRSA